MKTRLIASSVLVLGALALSSVYAAEPAPGVQAAPAPAPNDAGGLFLKLDTDKDGYVSRTEAAANKDVAKAFPKADANADRKLDPNEFATAVSNMGDKKK
jgi:hypothetical protein